MLAVLKIVHFLSLAVGLGGGIANGIFGAKVAPKAPEHAGPAQKLIGRLSFAALILLWVTGLWMIRASGGIVALGLWFWVKMIAVLALTAAAVAMQLAYVTLPPEKLPARAKVLGMVMTAAATLAVVFAVLAFG